MKGFETIILGHFALFVYFLSLLCKFLKYQYNIMTFASVKL
jgi:hypothetical protein